MNKVIFVGFNTEQQAYEGSRALHEMHREGTVTLYNDAIVVKEAGGSVAVRRAPDAGPVGTFGGMVTGGLVGLLGGPVGAVLGLGTGTLMGAAFDLTRQGVDEEFVEDAGARLEPGRAAVIAEIDEEWQAPLDARMEGLGGNVVRRTQMQIEDAYLEREIEAAQNELAELESETLADVKASQTDKARKRTEKLQTKIDAARRNVQKKEDELARKLKSAKDEGNQKIAMLEVQKATATAESKAALDRRLADVRADYERRTRRLQEALDRSEAAHATVA